ncbi:hypothetical protein WA026_001105 [Henosepilachna vigintioctopunctata]|uniref:Uncharacterized protein n=1 Tax=Henosepilachna vigintioctopunctata TaxID=420089 RepID=A0AAW1VAH8_9CUCU
MLTRLKKNVIVRHYLQLITSRLQQNRFEQSSNKHERAEKNEEREQFCRRQVGTLKASSVQQSCRVIELIKELLSVINQWAGVGSFACAAKSAMCAPGSSRQFAHRLMYIQKVRELPFNSLTTITSGK